MKLLIQGNDITVTDSIHDYVQQKLEKAVKHYQGITTKVDVHLSVARKPRVTNKHKAEVTVYANGTVIRAQEGSENLYASIDMVSDKIARQLRKYKEKQLHKKIHAQTNSREILEEAPIEEPVETNLISERTPQLPEEVVRTKYFSMPGMTVQEALEHLQLVDHDFYMFRNSSTDEINVIYCRNHGGYGVIQPKPETNGNGEQSGNAHHIMPNSKAVITNN